MHRELFLYMFTFPVDLDIHDTRRIWILRIAADHKGTNLDQQEVEWEKSPESEATREGDWFYVSNVMGDAKEMVSSFPW
jgi:hypothetical protein